MEDFEGYDHEAVVQPQLYVRQITESVDMEQMTKNSMMSCEDMN